MKHFRQTALACLIDCTSAYTGMRHAVGAALAIVLDGQRSGHDRSQHFRQTALACLIDCTSAYTGMRHAVGAALAIVLDGERSGHDRSQQCTIEQGQVEKEGRDGCHLKLLT